MLFSETRQETSGKSKRCKKQSFYGWHTWSWPVQVLHELVNFLGLVEFLDCFSCLIEYPNNWNFFLFKNEVIRIWVSTQIVFEILIEYFISFTFFCYKFLFCIFIYSRTFLFIWLWILVKLLGSKKKWKICDASIFFSMY